MRKFINGFRFAWNGIVGALGDQLNLRIQSGIAFLAFAAGVYFELTALEWCCLLLSVALVISMELINTSIEKLVDMVSPEFQPAAGRVKDIAAGSVLVAALISAVIGIFIFGPYVMAWWQSL